MPVTKTNFNTEISYLARLLEPSYEHDSDDDHHVTLKQLDYHGITLLAKHHGSLDKENLDSLGARQQMMVANELLKQNSLAQLLNVLHENGLNRTLIIKGTALAYSIYPQPWLRPRSDTDILIAKDQLPMYEEIFKQLKFNKQFAIEGNFLSYQCTWSKQLTENVSLHIDCHWRLSNRQILANIFTFNDLLDDAVTSTKLNSANLIPSKINSLFIATLHRIGHHSNEERLIWLYDIHLLASSLNEEEWSYLCVTAINKKIAAINLEALLSSHELFNTPLPQKIIENLNQACVKKEESSYFLNRQLSEWRYLLYDMRGLPDFISKLAFLRENLFPDASYLKQQMGTHSMLKAHFIRILNGIKRLAK